MFARSSLALSIVAFAPYAALTHLELFDNSLAAPPAITTFDVMASVPQDSAWTQGSPDALGLLASAGNAQTQTTYLPLVLSPLRPIPSELTGTVSSYGSAVAGSDVLLRFYEGSQWSTRAITTTDANGRYSFANLPTLAEDDRYYVLWQNAGDDPDWLAFWACSEIMLSTTSSEAFVCDFDLADVVLAWPEPGATLTLPYTFTWHIRALASDDYELNIADMSDHDPWWWTDPALGYVDHYTLSELPPGLSAGVEYGWFTFVYGPNGYGASHYYNPVTFGASGLEPPGMGTSIWQHSLGKAPRGQLPGCSPNSKTSLPSALPLGRRVVAKRSRSKA